MSPALKKSVHVPAFKGLIWEGIYSSFADVPKVGDGFAGSEWNSAMLEKGRLAIESHETPRNDASIYSTSLLPLVVALSGKKEDPVRILDFGGGIGTTFAAVAEGVRNRRLDYHVVEMPNVCEIGARIFKDDPRISFHSTLPVDITSVDIVHFGSSIQYVEDWRDFLQRVVRYRPGLLLFTELMAGDIPTFATAQNYYGSTIPAWFFNFREFTDHLARLGFRLEFTAPYAGTYLGKVQPVPQPNFAPEYRLGCASHALFRPDFSAPQRRTHITPQRRTHV